MFDENDVIAGRYRLLRQLGAGGMGVVWEAKDEQVGRSVAVKLIPPKLARDKKKLSRFETAAKAVAALHSPHIVQVLEYGVDKAPFVVMELLHGVVLTERMARGRVELDTAVRIMVQTADALTVAHDAGVVHRNLKLGNIFLVDDGPELCVKVFDFGTAKSLTGFRNANDITTMGAILGNPDYLAPEQLSGDSRSDHRADVWSLAAIAYHVITGVTPFEGEQMGAIMRSILFSHPEPPSTIDPTLPPALDGLFATALNKNREERYQSAREFSDALCDAVGAVGATQRLVVGSEAIAHLGDFNAEDQPETRFDGPSQRGADMAVVADTGPDAEPAADSGTPRDSSSIDDRAGDERAGDQPAPTNPASDVGDSTAVPPSSSRLDTPAQAALVRPTLTRSASIDLPSAPVLVLGALVFLALGGAAAWWVMAPDQARPARGSETSPARDAGAPVLVKSAPSTATTERAPPQPSPPVPSQAPSAEPSAAPSVQPVVSPRVPWPRVRPNPVDIYED